MVATALASGQGSEKSARLYTVAPRRTGHLGSEGGKAPRNSTKRYGPHRVLLSELRIVMKGSILIACQEIHSPLRDYGGVNKRWDSRIPKRQKEGVGICIHRGSAVSFQRRLAGPEQDNIATTLTQSLM